jgi:hypothetical protein
MKRCLTLINLAVLFFFIAGCKETIELNGYYDLYLQNDTYPAGAYKFYEDGRCFYYKYNRSTDERYPFNFDDVIPINKWRSYNDTLVIMGYGYKIVRQTPDTLVLKAFKGRNETLVKSKRQKDEGGSDPE